VSGSGGAAVVADAASEPRRGTRLGLGGAAVGTLQHDRTVSSGQFGGGAGVSSIGRHGHFVSLTESSGRGGGGTISALNASDVTLGCGRNRCGQLVVGARAFSGFNNEGNQRARR
jgi:hypothetical protein